MRKCVQRWTDISCAYITCKLKMCYMYMRHHDICLGVPESMRACAPPPHTHHRAQGASPENFEFFSHLGLALRAFLALAAVFSSCSCNFFANFSSSVTCGPAQVFYPQISKRWHITDVWLTNLHINRISLSNFKMMAHHQYYTTFHSRISKWWHATCGLSQVGRI